MISPLLVVSGEATGTPPHNAYTQVSSETGLPRLLMYLASIYYSCACLRRINKLKDASPVVNELKGLATCLRFSFLAFATAACFSSIAYLPYLPILCGLTVGLHFATHAALEQMEFN